MTNGKATKVSIPNLSSNLRRVAAMGPVGAALVKQCEERTANTTSSESVHSIRHNTRVFGEVVGGMTSLDAEAMNVFHAFLEASNYKPRTKHGLYTSACAAIRYLISTRVIPQFKVPLRYKLGAVLAVTPPPPRLLDGINLRSGDISDADLLSRVVEFAYSELDIWRQKRRVAVALISAVRPAYERVLHKLDVLGEKPSLAAMAIDWAPAFLADHRDELKRLASPTRTCMYFPGPSPEPVGHGWLTLSPQSECFGRKRRPLGWSRHRRR
jgi:hypothetical protein